MRNLLRRFTKPRKEYISTFAKVIDQLAFSKANSSNRIGLAS